MPPTRGITDGAMAPPTVPGKAPRVTAHMAWLAGAPPVPAGGRGALLRRRRRSRGYAAGDSSGSHASHHQGAWDMDHGSGEGNRLRRAEGS
jgi:hypothetical protein